MYRCPLDYRCLPALIYLLFVYCLTLLPSNCLERDEENVCVKKRLVKVLDVYPSDWMNDWNCKVYYPNAACDQIRSGIVNVQSVYFLQETLTCCPGWTRSEEGTSDGEDAEESCEIPCADGYFGENCQYECRCINGEPGCDPIDGSCFCLDGWTGRQCDQRCSAGSHGPSCSMITPFTCDNGGTNHPTTGECLCPSRYEGLACEVECPRGSECGGIQCEQCISHSLDRCDTVFGACFCKQGWRGRYCTDLCPLGFGGDFCQEECCSQRGRCFDDPTGFENSAKCLCNDGYYGVDCELECPDGFFGSNCEQECACPNCDSVTGHCESCPSGFKGPSCLERCSASEWGPSCASRCSCSSACDVFSGRCFDSNISWLVFPLLVFVTIAVAVVGFLLYRRRRKKAEGESRNDEITTGVSTAPDDERYSTTVITQQYNGFNRDMATAAQQGPYHLVQLNGSAAKYQSKPPARANAHNPLYGIEHIEGSQHGTGKPDNIKTHVYDAAPQGTGSRQPNSGIKEVVHEYDYLSQGFSKADEFDEAGPVYHTAY